MSNSAKHVLRQSLSKKALFIGLFFLLFVGVVVTGTLTHKDTLLKEKSARGSTQYLSFIEEVYATIDSSYWQNIEEENLVHFYRRVSESLLGEEIEFEEATKETLMRFLGEELEQLDMAGQKAFATTLSNRVLQGLEPSGRSALLSERKVEELENLVNNIHTQARLYENLGLTQDASKEQIAGAALALQTELEKKAPFDKEAQGELESVRYAHEVLSNEQARERYDTIGALPTVLKKHLTERIVYIYIEQFSPTTGREFTELLETIDLTAKPNALILDLRGNIGGSLDVVPSLLGPFIGPGNTAIAFFSKEVQNPIITQSGFIEALEPYKKVVLLADENTQSSGEVFLSALKRHNVGVFVGRKTRGWGTIERVFPIENQIDEHEEYRILLVHSLTLGDDNQPIEGRGIVPDIDTENPQWKEELQTYWNDTDLLIETERVLQKSPPTHDSSQETPRLQTLL